MKRIPHSVQASRRSLLKGAVAAAAAVGLSGCEGDPRAAASAAPAAAGSAGASTATAVTGFSAGTIPHGTVMAPGRVIGANDRILIGVIGVGGQGFGAHVKGLKKEAAENNIELIACCDVYTPRLERARKEMSVDGGRMVQAEKDYRRLLDNKEIDAVVVATPEHWHAPISLQAMDAGKHVYCEKPMCRYLDEAFQLIDTQKRTGKVFQLGIQYTSNPKCHAIGDFIRSGKIGPLVTGQGSYCRNAGKKGEWNYDIDKDAGPDNLDWATWLGTAPKRPWNDDSKERFFRYRKFWDYSAGILGDLMPHKLGPFLIASGNPEFPTRVTSLGSRKISTDREVDDTVQVMAEFPSGWTMIFTGSTVNEQGMPDMFRGFKATVNFSGENAVAKPERPFAEEFEETEIFKGGDTGIPLHHKNWLDTIRGGKLNNCPVELGAKVQAILAMAEMSSRTSRMMLFDQATRTVRAG
jgi:predicted dehydrogenase